MIGFRLRTSAAVELVVRRDDCSVLGRRFVHGRAGANRVRFYGRLHGRPLQPGRYTIDVVVIRGTSRRQVGAIGIQVVPPHSRLARAQRNAPVPAGCAGGRVDTHLPAAAVFVADDDSPLGPTRDAAAAPKHQRTGVLGVSLKPPRLPLPRVVGGGSPWIGLLFYVPLVLALATIGIQVARFLRGSWNP